jgi:hypothetical protein
MSLDDVMYGEKQTVLDQLAATNRPLSMSMVVATPNLGDNPGGIHQGNELESDPSFEGEQERSFEEDASATGDTPRNRSVSRCSSIRSTQSDISYASTGVSGISLSGISASSSGSRTGRSGRGKIVPLYNLAVSNRSVC